MMLMPWLPPIQQHELNPIHLARLPQYLEL